MNPTTPAPEKSRTLLIVDDEPGVVHALQREIRATRFERQPLLVEGFTDPLQALARAKEKTFDLVIADYRMPVMDGLSFLKAYAELQPDCPRLVISGQTDFAALTRMINETHIYRFIPKPWTEYFLKSSIFQALRLYQAQQENQRLADVLRRQGLNPAADAAQDKDLVLIVDDEPAMLSALVRDLTLHSPMDDLFVTVREELTHHRPATLTADKLGLHTCTSPRQALRMADDVSFSCIIADYRMPEMDGIALLQAFAEKQPDCERILISGEMNTESLVNALDLAHIFSYVGKPWLDFELEGSVAQALQHRRFTLENRLLAQMLRDKDVGLAD
ncbi:hypothetical protein DLREEDagrD3_08100 [Denitratisoma sp. agr-D3]